MLSAKDNFLETIKFGRPDCIPYSRAMPVTTIGFFGVNPDDNRPEGADTWTDLWQVRHRYEQEGMMPFPVSHPLEKLPDWDDYAWPEPHDPSLYEKARDKVAGIAVWGDILLSGSHRSTLLERAWKLVGMENLFMMMLNEPEKIQ